jgi:hypothetical protein
MMPSKKRQRLIGGAGAVVVLLAIGLGFALGGRLPWERSNRARGPARPAALTIRKAETLILGQEFAAAERLLNGASGAEARRARALLAIHRADCRGAVDHLSGVSSDGLKGIEELREFVERCAGAQAGGFIEEDTARGLWVRLQDRRDAAILPLLMNTLARARDAVEKNLGTKLARPLRVDLVRDLFSLSAVSGLPLESAETTGTVAVARFSRITMLSPRALRGDFAWQDTVAHEITHLVLSKATLDRAPLWLQEGVAKRQETRWRPPRAFDDPDAATREARAAWLSGQAVGVDKLGPSIAMLSSADRARIAFAEVESLVDYIIERHGQRVLEALLRELRTAPSVESALRGTLGYGLTDLQSLWRAQLPSANPDAEPDQPLGDRLSSFRAARFSELLFLEGLYEESADRAAQELDRAPRDPNLHFLAARAAQRASRGDALDLLGTVADVDRAHAGHLALLARVSRVGEALREHALGLDPLLIEAACPDGDEGAAPEDPLCAEAKSLPPRGAE